MRIVVRGVALVFLAVALLHAAALAYPALLEPDPPWRHALFVAVNGAVAVGLVTRFRGFILGFGTLVLQQLYSHGSYAVDEWRAAHRLAPMSLAVLVFMPLVLALVVLDRRSGLPRRPS